MKTLAAYDSSRAKLSRGSPVNDAVPDMRPPTGSKKEKEEAERLKLGLVGTGTQGRIKYFQTLKIVRIQSQQWIE